MSEAEVTNNFGAVPEKLQQGAEAVVEHAHRARGDHPAAETLRAADLGVHRFGEG